MLAGSPRVRLSALSGNPSTGVGSDYDFTEPDVFASAFLLVPGVFFVERVVFLRGFDTSVAGRSGSLDCISL